MKILVKKIYAEQFTVTDEEGKELLEMARTQNTDPQAHQDLADWATFSWVGLPVIEKVVVTKIKED